MSAKGGAHVQGVAAEVGGRWRGMGGGDLCPLLCLLYPCPPGLASLPSSPGSPGPAVTPHCLGFITEVFIFSAFSPPALASDVGVGPRPPQGEADTAENKDTPRLSEGMLKLLLQRERSESGEVSLPRARLLGRRGSEREHALVGPSRRMGRPWEGLAPRGAGDWTGVRRPGGCPQPGPCLEAGDGNR